MYTNRACIRRRGGKLLSYQVISTENCLRRTEAKGFAVFACGHIKRTHGSVYKQAKEVIKTAYALKKTAQTPCTRIAKTVQKNRRNKNERITKNQN